LTFADLQISVPKQLLQHLTKALQLFALTEIEMTIQLLRNILAMLEKYEKEQNSLPVEDIKQV